MLYGDLVKGSVSPVTCSAMTSLGASCDQVERLSLPESTYSQASFRHITMNDCILMQKDEFAVHG